jgi:2-oxoglutarate dehydrogenase complex dehydrogenase (E1) component-like enzyme
MDEKNNQESREPGKVPLASIRKLFLFQLRKLLKELEKKMKKEHPFWSQGEKFD